MPELIFLAAEEQQKGEDEEEEEDFDCVQKLKLARTTKSWQTLIQCVTSAELDSKMPNKNEFLKRQVHEIIIHNI